MMKIKAMVCCGSGMGSSQIIKMRIEQVAKKLGIELTEVHHCAVSEGRRIANNYDVVYVSTALAESFKDVDRDKTKVIELRNLLSAQEIEEKTVEVFDL